MYKIEDLYNTEYIKEESSRIKQMCSMLGLPSTFYSTVQLKPGLELKCSVERINDDIVRFGIFLENKNYKLNELKMTRWIFFRDYAESKIYVKNLYEIGRETMHIDPTFSVERLVTPFTDSINSKRFTGERVIEFIGSYGDLMHIPIKSLRFIVKNKIKLIAKFNRKTFNKYEILYPENNECTRHLKESLGFDRISSLALVDGGIQVIGFVNLGYESRRKNISVKYNENIELAKYVLKYSKSRLEDIFDKNGIASEISWDYKNIIGIN